MRSDNDQLLEVWEIDENGKSFVQGVEKTLTYWKLQTELCDSYGLEFFAPLASEFAVVSKKVMNEVGKVEGIRYDDQDNSKSGWLLRVEEEELNDESNFINLHLYHIAAKRLDLVPFFALPPGYGFTLENKDEYTVWYDEEVL